MAYAVVSEAQADAAEYGLDVVDTVYDMLVANAGTIKSVSKLGRRTLAADSIYRSSDKLPARTPFILLEPVETRAEVWTMGPTGTGERRMDFNVLVTIVDEVIGDSVTLTRSMMQLADRVHEAFARNSTLDGFCVDSQISPARYGYFAPEGGRRYLLGARMTFMGFKIVDIL